MNALFAWLKAIGDLFVHPNTSAIPWAISIVSAAMAFVALQRTSRLQRVQQRLYEKQEQLTQRLLEQHENNRGDVRVERSVIDGRAFVVISNAGKGPALNVTFTLGLAENQASPLRDHDKQLPISRLAPGSTQRLLLRFAMNTARSFPNAAWTWLNEDGSEGKQASQL